MSAQKKSTDDAASIKRRSQRRFVQVWQLTASQFVFILLLLPVFFSLSTNWNWLNARQHVFARTQVTLVDLNTIQGLFAEKPFPVVVGESDNQFLRSTLEPKWTDVLPNLETNFKGDYLSSDDLDRTGGSGDLRVRLGDVIEVKDYADLQLLVAATYDNRYLIKETIGETETTNPVNPTVPASFSIKLSGISNGLMREAYAADNANAIAPSPNKNTLEKRTPLNSSNSNFDAQQAQQQQIQPQQEKLPQTQQPQVQQQQIEQQQIQQPQVQSRQITESVSRTSSAVITSATVMVLSKADRLLKDRVILPLFGGGQVELNVAAKAMAQGVAQISPQLQFIREIFIYSPHFDADPSHLNTANQIFLNQSNRILMKLVHIYSLPLGPALTGLVDSVKILEQKVGVSTVELNPAYQYIASDTVIPLFIMLFIYLVLLYGKYGIKYRNEILPQQVIYAFYGASVVFVVVYIIFQKVVDLSSWFGTEAGLSILSGGAVLIPIWVVSAVIGEKLPGYKPSEERSDSEEVKTVLFNDTPVDDVRNDKLNFIPLIKALYQFLDNRDTSPPLSISINGPWGSGKSSIMGMLKTELDKTRRWKTVWFNAWHYQKQDQILAAFLQTISKSLSSQWKFSFALRIARERFKCLSLPEYLMLFIPVGIIGLWLYDPWLAQNASGVNESQRSENFELFINAGLSIFGIGGGAWVIKNGFLPFRLQFKKLYDVKDKSKRIGFIEEFTREFELYRKAIGRPKFLIVIDDLDRCAPDHIVEVLKAINIIMTSGDGSQRSFFILGYDRKYIIKSIEEYFKDYAKDGEVVDRNFGANYLKKMVTLSVSVPGLESDKVGDLISAMNEDSPEENRETDRNNKSGIEKFREWYVETFVSWKRKAITAVMLCLVTGWFVIQESVIQQPLQQLATPSGRIILQEEQISGKEVISLDIQDENPITVSSLTDWLVVVAVLLLIALYASYLRWLSPDRPTEEYAQEVRDSSAFINAVQKCKKAFPANPRDTIRLLNRMRFEYLIQDKSLTTKLSEEESITYSLISYRHAGFFNPEFVETAIIPLIGNKTTNVKQLLDKLKNRFHSIDEVEKDLNYLVDSGIDIGHFCNVDKLRTFIQLNRFLLVSRKMEEKSKTKKSKPESKKSKLEIENSEISNLVKAGEHVLVQEDIK